MSGLGYTPARECQQELEQSPDQHQARSSNIKMLESILDSIRGNLNNIERVWGRDSTQWRSATALLQQQVDENIRNSKVHKADVADMLKQLNLQSD